MNISIEGRMLQYYDNGTEDSMCSTSYSKKDISKAAIITT